MKENSANRQTSVQLRVDAILDLVKLSPQRLAIHWINAILSVPVTLKLEIAPILKSLIILHVMMVLAVPLMINAFKEPVNQVSSLSVTISTTMLNANRLFAKKLHKVLSVLLLILMANYAMMAFLSVLAQNYRFVPQDNVFVNIKQELFADPQMVSVTCPKHVEKQMNVLQIFSNPTTFHAPILYTVQTALVKTDYALLPSLFQYLHLHQNVPISFVTRIWTGLI
jgi:hypothetical protein